MAAKEELQKQICNFLEDAQFPITTWAELVEAFPEGALTTCKFEDVELKVGDAKDAIDESSFPFSDANAVADALLYRYFI
ncbi:MAG: MTH865 family protein [Firmicutes bacterium]|nr:MTH865 family protein [Bacillota bacterium]